MARGKAERWAELHDTAMRQFDAIFEALGPERAQCLADRRFGTLRGAQWEGDYDFQADETDDPSVGVPRMEIPKVHRSLIRIFSDYRNNRISVDFRAKGGVESSKADALDGLYRADENDSRGGGQAAYDNAFDEGIGGGFGAWRLRAEYEDDSDEENESQRVRIEPIYDADQSVWFDLGAKHQDKSDARHAFVIYSMTRDQFEREYPNASPMSFDKVGTGWAGYVWTDTNEIRLAEYYLVDDHSVTKRIFRSIATNEEQSFEEGDFDDEQEQELNDSGWEEVRRRVIRKQRVRKYIMSGTEILSDEGEIAGGMIPIVPFYAKRWFINGIERCMGHVRLSIDASRIYNTMVSSLVEAAAASPISKPIFAPEQVRGLEDKWANAMNSRQAFLLARPILDENDHPIQLGATGSLDPPQVAANVAALVHLAGQDIADLTGDDEQVDSVPANTSAQAIELVSQRVDVRDFIYMDNLRKSMKRSGEVWLAMARDLYVEEGREMVAMDQEGGQTTVKLGEPDMTTSGSQIASNDFTRGTYEVVVDVGPSSATRRDATVRALVGMSQAAAANTDVESANTYLTLAFVNMDGEGLGDVQDWMRMKLVRAGVIKPNDEQQAQLKQEQQVAAQQPPDAQSQALMAAAAQAQAQAQLAQSRTTQTIAAAEQARAKTAEILAGIPLSQRAQALEAVKLALSHQDSHNDRVAGLVSDHADRVTDMAKHAMSAQKDEPVHTAPRAPAEEAA